MFMRQNILKMMRIRLSRNKPIRAIQPHMFKPRVTDSDNMSAEADHDGQSRNAGHPHDISLRNNFYETTLHPTSKFAEYGLYLHGFGWHESS